MKRLSLLIWFTILVAGQTLSQTHLGLRLGGNLSTVKTFGPCYSNCGLSNLKRSNFPSYQIGLALNHPLTERLSLDIDLLYSKKGYEVRYFEVMILTYLSVPAILNIQLKDSPFDVLLGLEPGYLLSATQNIDGQAIDASELWQKVDVGLNLGLGYRFPFNPDFRVKFGYYLGLLSINGTASSIGAPSLKMQSFQFAVSYYLI